MFSYIFKGHQQENSYVIYFQVLLLNENVSYEKIVEEIIILQLRFVEVNDTTSLFNKHSSLTREGRSVLSIGNAGY